MCLLPFYLYYVVFPHSWVCDGLCDEHLQGIRGTVTGQHLLDAPCGPEGTDSICWKGVVDLRYELQGQQNHTCALRVIKSTTVPSSIEYAFQYSLLLDSSMNATIVRGAHDHCFLESELVGEMRNYGGLTWDTFRTALTITSSVISGMMMLLGALLVGVDGKLGIVKYEYNTLNVQDPPQEEAKMERRR